ncbi:hypothetical protein CN234_21555 [Sinorhizobium meliloti]|uniref:hypothetical protein n=1 Tax=Rhizobium meliloti TaxID=382 RepID=UPI000FD7B630|nr:hypothetical protein [Sinorhizobium meliloti]TWB03194.1 hypothetical protein FB000_10451 [Ensifer sp. SEMIA 134]TWB39488.1 hypothetical protein FB001_103276 [Ensifer sp. SEMIA 135]RVG06599.1 hypothetical protein CN234_21555 [Sinorhizobium meliloti]RVL12185.1 hypothetical protein CN147_32525 [Sinorhizobium meliloti]RVP96737.1 hypothetical protein CN069_25850 [Sinorhizobium meliloti]
MSDELGAKPHYEAGPYVHYCEHPGCEKWGSFGFAVGRGEPNWYCGEHRPEWKAGPIGQATLTSWMARGISEI